MGIKMYNKQACHNPQQMTKKTEKLLFSLLDNPTLNPNFKWQTLKLVALILIRKWKFYLS